MKSNFITAFTILLLMSSAQAGIVITDEDGSRQYFHEGSFVLVEDGQPVFGVDADGNCWFVEKNQRIVGECDAMFGSMDEARQEMMAGMSEQERTMMQEMMKSRTPNKKPDVEKIGSKQIAGYSTECYKIGEQHEVCISEKLLKEIEREMDSSSFMDLQTKFGHSDNGMGMYRPEHEALLELYRKGFPMEDLQRVAEIPGMNPAMLQFIPEDQREEIKKQMGAAGKSEMVGSRVIKVEKNGTTPKIDMSHLKTVSFKDYMQQMMEETGGFSHKP